MQTSMGTLALRERQPVERVERRRSQRIRIQVPVFVRGTDPAGVEFAELTKTLNISIDGASIASTHSMRPENILQLTFPSPSTPSSSTVPVETPPLPARVKRNQIEGGLTLLGLEFLRQLK